MMTFDQAGQVMRYDPLLPLKCWSLCFLMAVYGSLLMTIELSGSETLVFC